MREKRIGVNPVGVAASLAVLVGVVGVRNASAHCEIPCGIYGDELRVELLAEHIGTVEKSMKTVVDLGRKRPVPYNQLVRWVENKDAHADKIQHIVTQYFMTQRVAPGDADYGAKIHALHSMLISAMKCKQTTDLAHVAALRSALKRFEGLYFKKGRHSHKSPGKKAK